MYALLCVFVSDKEGGVGGRGGGVNTCKMSRSSHDQLLQIF